MTGPEHYAAAEALLEQAKVHHDWPEVPQFLAEAQVHATLALTAATAATRAVHPQELWGVHSVEVCPEWQEALS